ncbi:hypothetical protein GW17_00049458 [Ensete ventricosum]|nr:hypothetical protein GW17_00049458 [Ensete ventricosum]
MIWWWVWMGIMTGKGGIMKRLTLIEHMRPHPRNSHSLGKVVAHPFLSPSPSPPSHQMRGGGGQRCPPLRFD